jgi:hypothetical protein
MPHAPSRAFLRGVGTAYPGQKVAETLLQHMFITDVLQAASERHWHLASFVQMKQLGERYTRYTVQRTAGL